MLMPPRLIPTFIPTLRTGLIVAVTSALVTSNALAQTPAAAPTRIEVTDTVQRPATAYEPLGLNNLGDAGGTKYSQGNLILQSSFDPATMRDLYRVIDAGEENGRRWISLDQDGTSRYQLYTSGTYSGAEMRAYRFLDAQGQPLPYKEAGWAQGGKLLDATNGAECRPLFTTTVLPKGTPGLPNGGWLADTPGVETYADWQKLSKEEREEFKKTWRVYYDSPEPLRMDDVVIFRRSFLWPDPADFHPRVSEKGVSLVWDAIVGQFRQIPAPADTPAAMNAGAGVLELTPEAGVAQAWYKLFGGTGRKDARWYATLEEGVTYRYEAWVKATDTSAPATLTFGFGENRADSLQKGYFGDTSVNKAFPVTGQWQRIGYTFTAPGTPANGGIEGAILRYEGPGQLLVDNVKLQPVYQPGDADKPFVINRTLFKTLIDNQPPNGRKGALRMWPGLSPVPMTELLQWDGGAIVRLSNRIQVAVDGYTSIPKTLTILEATGDSPATRMIPWIITQVTHDENEYRQLVEYLAAPYDPATDTPESKPLAYLRTQQRGHNRPWTEDFREVIIEFGNENWHNRANDNWIGLGRSGTVHQAGIEYGLWGAHMIAEMRKSPYYDAKLHITFGGNYSSKVNPDGTVSGYGQDATVAAKGANTYHSHATYIGPRWETGESSETSIDDPGVQKTLLAYRPVKEEEWQLQADANAALQKLGYDVKMNAYEGGPSGFGLRAKTPEEDRAGEYYGKSYAMGTAMLDAWLDAWAKGWTHQCYLGFAQGKWWSSHTSISQGHRPSPGFLVQTMINHTLANRDMLTVKVENAPTIPYEKAPPSWQKNAAPVHYDVPTLQAHAFGGDGTYAVALSNLSLTNDIPVEINLPVQTVSKITLYTLAGGPRDTNMDEEKVTLTSRELPAEGFVNGTYKPTMPAGRPAVFVFEK